MIGKIESAIGQVFSYYPIQGPGAQSQTWLVRANITLRISVHYDTLFLTAKNA